jgi:hypothetical protein
MFFFMLLFSVGAANRYVNIQADQIYRRTPVGYVRHIALQPSG